MRIVFFGAKAFAVPCFEALIAAGHEIAALVTDPASEKGHGPEVVAGAWRFPVLEPPDLKDRETEARLRAFAPDAQVVVGYHLPLPPALLKLPRLGTVKVQPSLLPRQRGPAPIPWAILQGDEETGVTTLVMDGGADTGPILVTRSTPIAADETAGELEFRLARLGAEVLLETLTRLEKGDLTPKAQSNAKASDAPALPLAAEDIDWATPAETLARRVRAFQPQPGTQTRVAGRLLKVLRAAPAEGAPAGEPGTIVVSDFDGIVVACSGGSALRLTQVQLEDMRPMSPTALISRLRLRKGTRLG